MRNLIFTFAVLLLTVFSLQAQDNKSKKGDAALPENQVKSNGFSDINLQEGVEQYKIDLNTEGQLVFRKNGTQSDSLVVFDDDNERVQIEGHLYINSDRNDALIIQADGDTGGSGPLLKLEDSNGSDKSTIGLIPLDNNLTYRSKSLEVRMPDNGRINFFNSNDVTAESNISMIVDSDGDVIVPNGKVGVGEDNPQSALHIKQDGTGINNGMRFETAGTSGEDWYIHMGNDDDLRITNDNSTSFKILKNSGSVAIGSDLPPTAGAYMLSVDGDAIVEELVVELSGDWPDYVFEEEYDLKPLSEVKSFIDENGHLPNVPSAEVLEASDGIAVGEMQRIMMEKIEELTLYIIELEAQVKELKK